MSLENTPWTQITDILDMVLRIPAISQDPCYVSKTGSDDNDGSSWDEAFLTIDYAVGQCSEGDVIYVAPGTYDETANGPDGVLCDVANITIVGLGKGVAVRNTDVSAAGNVFQITASNVRLVNMTIRKGEVVNAGSITVLVNGAITGVQLIDCVVALENDATAEGVKVTGGAAIVDIMSSSSAVKPVIYGTNSVGIGMNWDNCSSVGLQGILIGSLTTGLLIGASGTANYVDPDTHIVNCTTGISITAGASNNILMGVIGNCTTDIVDNSGNATNDAHSSPTHMHDEITHIEKFTGKIWFVDDATGADTNTGRNVHEAFATIGNAINNASAGDAIKIKAGDYYENNLDLNLIGLELWGEIGVTIYTNTTTGLTVSARNCRVREIILSTAGQTALELSGNYGVLEAVTCIAPTIGIDLSGQGNRLRDITVVSPTVTGIDLSGPSNILKTVTVSNPLVAARGFYLSAATADQNILMDCHSIGNTTAGYEIVAGAQYNSIVRSTSGGGDGPYIDSGEFNMWDIVDSLPTERHEETYPSPAGQGVAANPVTIDNTATDDTPDTRSDINYWGDIVPVIPPDTLTDRWSLLGLYIYATTAADTQPWEIFLTNDLYKSAQNGGNDWDLGETALTVADGTIFTVGDYVWITGADHTDGEILIVSNVAGNIVTVASETRMSGNTGVRYNYDVTAVGNTMYVVWRDTQANLKKIAGDFSASGAREFTRIHFHNERMVPPNGGLLMRMLNGTDNGDSSFDVRIIYED